MIRDGDRYESTGNDGGVELGKSKTTYKIIFSKIPPLAIISTFILYDYIKAKNLSLPDHEIKSDCNDY